MFFFEGIIPKRSAGYFQISELLWFSQVYGESQQEIPRNTKKRALLDDDFLNDIAFQSISWPVFGEDDDDDDEQPWEAGDLF